MKYQFFIFSLLCTTLSASHQPQQPVFTRPHNTTSNLRIVRWFHDLVGTILQDTHDYPELKISFIIEQNINLLHNRITRFCKYYDQLKTDLQTNPNNQFILNEFKNQFSLDYTTPFTPQELSLYHAFIDILHGDQTPHAKTLLCMLQQAFPGQYHSVKSLKITTD